MKAPALISKLRAEIEATAPALFDTDERPFAEPEPPAETGSGPTRAGTRADG